MSGLIRPALRLDHRTGTCAIDQPRPRVSWQMPTEDERMPPAPTLALRSALGEHTAQLSDYRGHLADWPFRDLEAFENAELSLRNARGVAVDTLPIVVGPLHRSDWSADLISASVFGGRDHPAPEFTTAFVVGAGLVRADLFVSGHGIVVGYSNGLPTSPDRLVPGWTDYATRLRIVHHDIRSTLRAGLNTLTFVVGNGWFRGQLVYPDHFDNYGTDLGVTAELRLEYADGATQVVCTDETWRHDFSRITANDFYQGETIDFRVPAPGTRDIDSYRHPVVAAPLPHDVTLFSGQSPPIREFARRKPHELTRLSPTRLLVDFGQNLAGYVGLRSSATGRPGDVVRVQHAEVLQHGTIYRRPLRSASASVNFILSDGPCIMRPDTVYSGFRYAEITGPAAVLDGIDVDAAAESTDLTSTLTMTTGHAALDKLIENITWSARSNFVSIPTDCPQRDERLGWTGDIRAFGPAALAMFDSAGFLLDWLEEVRLAQGADGSIPHVVPDVLRIASPAAAGWGDVITFLVWDIYQATGDTEPLRRFLPAMTAWVERIRGALSSDGTWREDRQFGDWLDPAAPAELAGHGRADPHVVSTAFYARSAKIASDAASVIGDTHAADTLAGYAREAHDAFQAAFVSGPFVESDCPTVYALALEWDLILAEQRSASAARLAELVRSVDHRICTGFLGTPHILDALTNTGYAEDAVSMLLNDECPGWLYAVKMGATTTWERWDAIRPDGSVHPGTMTSFNHYCYGSVLDWMRRQLGGVHIVSPGYEVVRYQPIANPRLPQTDVIQMTPFGVLRAQTSLVQGAVHATLDVPDGMTVVIGSGAAERILGFGHHDLVIPLEISEREASFVGP